MVLQRYLFIQTFLCSQLIVSVSPKRCFFNVHVAIRLLPKVMAAFSRCGCCFCPFPLHHSQTHTHRVSRKQHTWWIFRAISACRRRAGAEIRVRLVFGEGSNDTWPPPPLFTCARAQQQNIICESNAISVAFYLRATSALSPIHFCAALALGHHNKIKYNK